MKCPNHPENEVTGACVGCGNFFCGDCLAQVHGKNYCKACLVELAETKNRESPAALPVQPQIIVQQQPQQQQQPPQQKSNEWEIIIAVCCIILIVFFAIGIAMSPG